MDQQAIQTKKDILQAIRKQLDMSKKLNQDIIEETKQLSTGVEELNYRLKPVTKMIDQVSVAQTNINSAL